MSLSGNLKTMELAELLQWITLGRKTGSLAFIQNKVKNYIYFRDGGIVSSRSNEPTKQLGHFLLFQGKISEEQLRQGLELQQRHHQHLGKILVQQGFISQQEVEKALVDRTQEVIYDIFLWEDGYFHFASSGYNLEDLILINLDINSILFEGVRRKDEWNRIRQKFPTNDVVLALRSGANPKTLPLTPVQKKLLFLVTRHKTIAEMILELHGSEFLVNDELYKLHERGVLEVQNVLRQPPAKQDSSSLIKKGVELLASLKPREALATFQEVLRIEPQNASAEQYIAQAEKDICEEYYAGAISPHKVPYYLVPEESLTQYNLTNEEGFVATRINSTWDLKSIMMLSPLPELEFLQIVDKLMKMGLIALK
jgi:hypothetical protein